VSKNVAVFVDVANLYYSARGQEVDVDYVALLKAATKGRDLIRAYAYSGLDPENENQRKFIDFLGKNGYKVVHKDIRKFGDGRVKANLDIELVVDLFRLAKRMDIAVIVSGDGDFAPAIRALQDEGVRCEVISFRPNTSSDLIAVADEFIDIMKIASIGRGAKESKAEKGMSAPPMPAKEVVPEFGFREASPGVAAAALAALRGGKEAPAASTRGRGRGRSRPAPTEAEEAPVAPTNGNGAAVATSADSEDGRRRRRRRGGRGRGRGRHGEETGGVPEPTGEIGWVEVDDISQLEELDSRPLTDDAGAEREYTFEEADEATLAELGLLDAGSPVAVAADQAAETKPARRSRSRKPAADAEAAEATPAAARGRSRKASSSAGADAPPADAPPAEAAEEKPKPARRTRGTKTAGTATPKSKGTKASSDAAASDAPDAAAKPKRSRSAKPSAPKPKAQSPGSETSADTDRDGQPQGIWQRFRSARGGTAN
jgi:uncharacterized LabA/DUF88 family protein